MRLGGRAWIVIGAALLPLFVLGAIYHARSYDATRLLAVEEGQTAATIPDEIAPAVPLRAVISEDRGTVAYVGSKGAEQCLCVNDSLKRCATEIGMFVVSGDGSRIAWAEADHNPLTNEVLWHVMTDGTPGPNYREIRNLEMAAHTGRVSYIARSDQGLQHVFGDDKDRVYPDIRWITISPDGTRSFYVAALENRLTPVLDGVAGPPFDQFFSASFSPDGRHLAYIGNDTDGMFLMIDGKRTAAPPELNKVAWNADGSRLCRVFASPAGIWLSEGDRTSQVFQANYADVGFSSTGVISATVRMIHENGSVQVWQGADVAKLQRSRATELPILFYRAWWPALTEYSKDHFSAPTSGLDGDLAFVELSGRHLLWHRLHWPPSHITKVDMAHQEPGLRESRDAVLAAIKDRSVDRLLAYVDPTIRISFGDPCCGVAQFRAAFNLDDRSSPSWGVLQRVIENGGLLSNFRGTLIFTAPYTFNLPLPVGPLLAGDELGFVAGTGTKLYSEPRTDSAVLRTFDWEPAAYLTFEHESPANADIEKQWARVRALDGRVGYVERARITNRFEERAVFEKRNGVWIITDFVSGD